MTAVRDTQKSARQSDDATMHAEAAHWHHRLGAGPLSAEEARAFGAWIAAHPEHGAMLETAKALDRALAEVPNTPAYEAWMRPSLYERVAMALDDFMTGAPRRVSVLRYWPAAIVGVATIALAAFLVLPALYPEAPPQLEPQIFETQIAEVRDVTLPDGSVVTIDAASAIRVEYSESERRVVLSKGGAFFDVERDPGRPFSVAAADNRVRVLGTKFDVALNTASVDVAVAEGRVEFSSTAAVAAQISDVARSRSLRAGQMATALKSGAVGEIASINIDDVGAWRRGELFWAEAPLNDIIADLNRYADPGVILAANGVGDLEFTLGVRTDDVAGAVDLIAASLGLEVERGPDGTFVLR